MNATVEHSTEQITGKRPSALAYAKLGWWALGAFALVWIVEIYLVQRATLIYSSETGALFRFTAPLIRLTLDALFVVGLTLLLPRWSLVLTSLVVFASNLGLTTYTLFFSRPLSFLTIKKNWSSFSHMSGVTWELIPNRLLWLLTAVLLLKLILLWWAGRLPYFYSPRWKWGAAMVCGYFLILFGISYRDPLSAIKTTRGVGRLGAMRGYLEPWAAEWFFLTDSRLLEIANEAAQIPSDKLSPHEADIPIRRQLIIIQAESLGNHCVDYQVQGRPVMPFLAELKKRALYYRVSAFHSLGSSDADFVMLTGRRPVSRTNMYVVMGYPYAEFVCLPQLLAPLGYKTTGIHGMSGSFYERRQAYEQMGFDALCFEEEMNKTYGLESPLSRTRWGVRDQAVLDLSRRFLKETSPDEKICHFIITLTTHTPFNMLEPQPDDLFSKPKNALELYLNNMHYLDRCLRDYVTTLRDATVVIYGDHSVGNGVPGWRTDQIDNGHGGFLEYVPCLIYDTEEDLSQLQKTRARLATQGTLNFLDVVTYLRKQIVRSQGAQSAVPMESTPAESSPAKTAR